MNIFLSQSIQTKLELEEIADLKYQIVIPTTSKTTIGVVQDGLIGVFNLTSTKEDEIDWRNAMNLIAYTDVNKFNKVDKDKIYSGQYIFSQIIPKKININKDNFKIHNGDFKIGVLNKDTLGAGKKNTIHQLIWDEYGADKTLRFLNNIQRLINNYNLFKGFTVNIGDMIQSNDIYKQIYQYQQSVNLKVSHKITEIENNPNLMTNELFEDDLFAEINVIRDEISKLLQENLKGSNNLSIMSKSGSKGDPTNYVQIAGCVGLQAFEGKLMPKIINNRTLPYFFQNDDRPESRGLIASSFVNGINFSDFVFMLTAARAGSISTAVRTAESGYIARKLIKIQEDIMVKYDGTVRAANNSIVQFIYGDTGADTTKQYEYTIKLLEYGDSYIEDKFKFTDDELKNIGEFSRKENEEYIKFLIDMRDQLRNSQVRSRMDFMVLNSNFMLPINLSRIVEGVKNNSTLKDNSKLTAKFVLDSIEEILNNENTKLICINPKDRNNKNSIKYQDDQLSKTTLKIALHNELGPKRSIVEYKLSKSQFEEIKKQIIFTYNKNIVEAGEHVGVIASQSMGEPITQMTISAFHQAGIAAIKNLTSGLPRIKELLSLSKKIKTPQMIIFPSAEYKTSKQMAKKIASHIQYITLGDIRSKINVYFDPNPYDKDGFMEKDNVYNVYYTHNPSKSSCQADIENLPWLLRIEIDRERMLEKEVTLLDIKSKFCNLWEKRYADIKNIKKEEKYILDRVIQCALLSNSDNDIQPIIHLRFDMTEFEITLINDFIDLFIDKFKLKGIPGVNRISTIRPDEIVLNFDNENHEVKKEEQNVIYTEGINLYDIRYINGIDIYKTLCNDINMMYETFGIEAARATIIRELTLSFERENASVNYQHFALLVDMMTCNGYLSSIDRHGMNKSDADPLSKASFEKMVDHLINAAVFNEVDHMKGVSSRIMAGLVVKGGTGACDVILNTEMLEKSEFIEDVEQSYNRTYKDITTSNVIKDVLDKEETGEIFMPE